MDRQRVRNRLLILLAAVSLFLIALYSVLLLRRAGRPKSVDLPDVAEIESLEVSLWASQIGLTDTMNCKIGKEHFGRIIRCLSPAEVSDAAEGMVHGLPPLGELKIRLKSGKTRRVIFVQAGKNPLCFEIDGFVCIRGGQGYRHYLKDHQELYDLPSQSIDESLVFARLLYGLCNGAESPKLLDLILPDLLK